jgi:hypothetical protein
LAARRRGSSRRAQQGDRVRRIGWLLTGDENDPLARTLVSAFIRALADLGLELGDLAPLKEFVRADRGRLAGNAWIMF